MTPRRSRRMPRLARATRDAAAASRPSGRAERAALARLERRIGARLRDGEAAAWDVGMLFDRIARASLHHAAGYDSLEPYADARFPGHGYSTLRRYRRIALAFRRATVMTHGVHKLELGLRYIELTPADERPTELLRLRISTPGEGSTPFARATTAQLEAAIRALDADAAPALRLPRGAGTKVRALETRLSRGPAWPIARPRLTTRVARGQDGAAHALVTIHDVPIEDLGRLATALRSAT